MSVYNSGDTMRHVTLGNRVDRATATLPQTTAAAIFNITGGRVAITQIVGEVTTIIETKANDTKIVSNPTTGTDADLCAVLNITADEVGTLYGITGLNTDALIGINAGALPMQVRHVIVPIGTIDLNCAASNTGSVKWSIFYYPIDSGAAVAAA
jgi:hypothetical protein